VRGVIANAHRAHQRTLAGMPSNSGPREWMHSVPQGTLDARVLWQSKHWVTVEAEVLALADMSDEHLANVVRMLRNHALAIRVHLDAMIDTVLAMLSDEAAANAETLTRRALGTSLADFSAEQYLETTPLLRAVRRELAARQARHQQP
jgi:hypothetical protein